MHFQKKKNWDVKTRSRGTNIGGHAVPVNAMSFSENGYLLATAGIDAVKIWDLRTYGDDTPINGGFPK
jgi:WD40 repeat protein